jgi:hypothetical protein
MYRGEERCVQGLVGKPEVKKPLGIPGHVKKDNIRIYLK